MGGGVACGLASHDLSQSRHCRVTVCLLGVNEGEHAEEHRQLAEFLARVLFERYEVAHLRERRQSELEEQSCWPDAGSASDVHIRSNSCGMESGRERVRVCRTHQRGGVQRQAG